MYMSTMGRTTRTSATIRPSPDSTRDPVSTGEKILPGSTLLINAISGNMRAGYRLWPDAAVEMTDEQLATDQRFFYVELDQAAEGLARAFPLSAAPYGTDLSTWRMLLGNNLGWRVVAVTACRTGYQIDPRTKGCVRERTARPPAAPELELEPEPGPLLPPPIEAQVATGTPTLLIAAVAVVALLLVR